MDPTDEENNKKNYLFHVPLSPLFLPFIQFIQTDSHIHHGKGARHVEALTLGRMI